MLPEYARHLRQHARPVHGHDAQVVGRADILHTPEGQRPLAERGQIALHGRDAVGDTPGDLERVRPDGRRGGQLPRAPTVEHQVADIVAGDEDGVEDARHRGHWRTGRNHGGVHAGLERPVGGLGDGQELDPVAELGSVLDILLGDGGDPFRVDVLEVYGGAEGDGGQDLELVRRVHAFDIQGGVCFRVAVRLRLLEDDGEVEPLVGHLGKDVVAGTVDDAEGREHAVGREPVLDGADERDAARHGRLEAQHRRLEPAHQLDDDLDRRVVEHPRGVGDEGEALEVQTFSLARRIGIRDGVQGEPATGALLHFGAVRLENLDDAAADRAEAEEADLDLVHVNLDCS